MKDEYVEKIFRRFKQLSHIEFNGVKWRVEVVMPGEDTARWAVMLSVNSKEKVLLQYTNVQERWKLTNGHLWFARRDIVTGAVSYHQANETLRQGDFVDYDNGTTH